MCSQNVYSETLISHFKHPRNKGRLSLETVFETGYNPICGDIIYLSILLSEHDIIEDIMFDGKGCMICLASASILTTQVKGKPLNDVLNLIHEVENMFKKNQNDLDIRLHHDIKALSSIRQFPTRSQCVTLAWKTIEKPLLKNQE